MIFTFSLTTKALVISTQICWRGFE